MAMAKNKESPWMYWQEIAEIFNCCRAKAYRIIRQLNDELETKGFLVYPGRVSRKYFNQRYFA